MNPRMMPARTRSLPFWAPFDSRAWRRAMNPKMMARTEPTPTSQKKNDQTKDATAHPLVVGIAW
jgi:hypothetical protein